MAGSPQRRASDINEEKFEGNNQKDHLTHQKNLQVVKLKIVSNSRLHAAEKPTDKINIEVFVYKLIIAFSKL